LIPTSNATTLTAAPSVGSSARWKAAFGALVVALLWLGIAVETPRAVPSAGAFGRSVADATARRLLHLGARDRAAGVVTTRAGEPPRADRGSDAAAIYGLDRIVRLETALERVVVPTDVEPARPAFAFQPRGPPDVDALAAV